MENRGGPSGQEKMEWAAKETERRLKKLAEAKERGEEPPEFEPIDMENVTDDVTELTDADLTEVADEEWEEASKAEAAEEAKLQAEHEKAVAELDTDISLSAMEGESEQAQLEAEEEAKRAEIQAEEQRQMEEARQAMEAEQAALSTDMNVESQQAAAMKHEAGGEEVMGKEELAAREAEAASLLGRETPPSDYAESGTAVVVEDGPDREVGLEPSVVVDDAETKLVMDASKDAQQRSADLRAQIIDKRAQVQRLEQKISAQPDDASSVFQKEMLEKDIADLEQAEQSLLELASATSEKSAELPADTSMEEVAEGVFQAEVEDKGLEFSTQEKAFFEQGEQISASNEQKISELRGKLDAVLEQYNALQKQMNQATSKKGLFGGLWSGIKNALGRGDESKLRKLAEQRDDLQEQLGILDTEREAPLTPELPSDFQAAKKEARKSRIVMDKLKGRR